MHFLGLDVGSSSIKASLLDAGSGRSVASATHPDGELEIRAPRPGWAEQEPETWWQCAREATRKALSRTGITAKDVQAIGIAYQMHGLVLVDARLNVLRPSIIWCDSRAVAIGRRAFAEMGKDYCLRHLMNSPGNFTASKAKWVKDHEPELFRRAYKMMLPGDYLAMKLTGRVATTASGLSEGMLWDFEAGGVAERVLEYFGLPREILPELVPTFGEQGRLTKEASQALGLLEGTPVTYRAGDQPNNALSLNVLEAGEIAATAGTSGVVYGVTDVRKPDRQARVNGFAHVNHESSHPRLGILLCINGCGIANRWTKGVTLAGAQGYDAMNTEAARAPAGSEGLVFIPFGNGAERMLGDREPGARLHGLSFNLHSAAHLLRAVQEGVAFAFKFGLDILAELDVRPTVLRAGLGNLFASALFRETLATVSGVTLELYDTDGAQGAARAAAVGAGYYPSLAEAFGTVERRDVVEPHADGSTRYQSLYLKWKEHLDRCLDE